MAGAALDPGTTMAPSLAEPSPGCDLCGETERFQTNGVPTSILGASFTTHEQAHASEVRGGVPHHFAPRVITTESIMTIVPSALLAQSSGRGATLREPPYVV